MPNNDKLLYDVVLLDQLDHIINIITPEPVSMDYGRQLVNQLIELTNQPYCLIDEINLSNERMFPMWSHEEH